MQIITLLLRIASILGVVTGRSSDVPVALIVAESSLSATTPSTLTTSGTRLRRHTRDETTAPTTCRDNCRNQQPHRCLFDLVQK